MKNYRSFLLFLALFSLACALHAQEHVRELGKIDSGQIVQRDSVTLESHSEVNSVVNSAQVNSVQVNPVKSPSFIILHKSEPVASKIESLRAREIRGRGYSLSHAFGHLQAAQRFQIDRSIRGEIAAHLVIQSDERSALRRTLHFHGIPFSGEEEEGVHLVANASFAKGLSPSVVSELQNGGYTVLPEKMLELNLYDSVPLIGADKVWSGIENQGVGFTGKGVRVGLLDSGADYTHKDLGGCTTEQVAKGLCPKVAGGYDFINKTSDLMDSAFHGTHVAATIAGNGTLKGVAPDATLYVYKVCSESGCPESAILKALDRVVDPNSDGDTSDRLDVINLSLGGSGTPDDTLSLAIDHVVSMGTVAVIAAGNSGPSAQSIRSPGTSRSAITVGASYARNETGTFFSQTNPIVDQLASFSSRGPVRWSVQSGTSNFIEKPDLIAPGVHICAALSSVAKNDTSVKRCVDDTHISISGTSMATPHITGTVALMLEAHPHWTPLEIKNALKASAVKVVDPQTSLHYRRDEEGYGRVDALHAVLTQNPISDLPDVYLLSPGKVAGSSVPLSGIVHGTLLTNYTLSFRKNKSSDSWKVIAQGSQPIDGIIGNFVTDTLSDGLYDLFLSATFSDGSSYDDFQILELNNVEITEPETSSQFPDISHRKFSPRAPISIKGTVQGAGLDHYALVWCYLDGSRGGRCSTEGIALVEDGKSQIKAGVLGTWSPPIDRDVFTGSYSIGLTAYYKDGRKESAGTTVELDREYLPGFPQYTSASTATLNSSTITTADLNKDGKSEIITLDGGTIKVLDVSGRALNGWPKTIPNGNLQALPIVKDLDGDGYPEILIQDYKSNSVNIFRRDGTMLASWVPMLSSQDAVKLFRSTVLPVDLDGDGVSEILIHDTDAGSLFAFSLQGALYKGKNIFAKSAAKGFLLSVFGQIEPSLAEANIDGSGSKKIIAVDRSLKLTGNEGSFFYVDFSKVSTVIDLFDREGREVSPWPITLQGYQDKSSVAVADLNGDGKDEIIVRVQDGDTVKIHALQSDGSELPHWPVTLPSYNLAIGGGFQLVNVSEGVSIGDLDNDGSPELVTSVLSSNISDCTFAISATGAILKNWPVCGYYNWIGSSPIIANLDSDTQSEILLPSSNRLSALKVDGSLLYGYPRQTSDSWGLGGSGCTVADLDGDHRNEIVCDAAGALFAWNREACSNDAEEWPSYFHSAARDVTYRKSEGSRCVLPEISLPTFLTQPLDIPLSLVRSVPPKMFEASVVSRTSVAFSWQKLGSGGWVAIDGAKTSDFTPYSEGTYRLLATNLGGTSISRNATVYQDKVTLPTLTPFPSPVTTSPPPIQITTVPVTTTLATLKDISKKIKKLAASLTKKSLRTRRVVLTKLLSDFEQASSINRGKLSQTLLRRISSVSLTAQRVLSKRKATDTTIRKRARGLTKSASALIRIL